jgi:hypothetical protein
MNVKVTFLLARQSREEATFANFSFDYFQLVALKIERLTYLPFHIARS